MSEYQSLVLIATLLVGVGLGRWSCVTAWQAHRQLKRIEHSVYQLMVICGNTSEPSRLICDYVFRLVMFTSDQSFQSLKEDLTLLKQQIRQTQKETP